MQAYSASGRSWLAICNEDSDKDGKTNGEELGDPNCVWRPGQTPDGNAIGHPGMFLLIKKSYVKRHVTSILFYVLFLLLNR